MAKSFISFLDMQYYKIKPNLIIRIKIKYLLIKFHIPFQFSLYSFLIVLELKYFSKDIIINLKTDEICEII